MALHQICSLDAGGLNVGSGFYSPDVLSVVAVCCWLMAQVVDMVMAMAQVVEMVVALAPVVEVVVLLAGCGVFVALTVLWVVVL